jgi:inner membrane protein
MAGPDERRYLRPTLAMSITDPRGLKGLPALTWRGTTRSTEPGVGASGIGNGIHLALGAAARPGAASFSLAIELQGTERLEIAPLGRETEVQLASDWPHPSFVGRYLPDHREIGDAGFRATWRTTHFATGAPAEWRKLLTGPGKHGANTLGVAFIEPVDFYTLSYRAAEYGFLLVVLTFGMFLLIETLKGVRIHPIQYALIGLALAVFFLLLLALGEHIGFTAAYALAALACTLLLAFYSRHVFGSWRSALRYTAWNAGLYGTLYVILGSEDYALALGATLVFLAIATGMVASREFDWYSLTGDLGTAAHRAPPPVPD